MTRDYDTLVLYSKYEKMLMIVVTAVLVAEVDRELVPSPFSAGAGNWKLCQACAGPTQICPAAAAHG